MADRFASLVTVTALAPAASITVAHNIVVGGVNTAPQEVMPDRATALVVTVVTATTITFNNPSSSAATAVFVARWNHSITNTPADLAPGAYWQGNTAASAALFETHTTGWSSVISALGVMTNFDQTLTVPAGTVTAGKVLELDCMVISGNGDGAAFDLLVDGVSVIVAGGGGYPVPYTAGVWPFRCIVRLTFVPTNLGAPPLTDVITAVRMEYTFDTGTGPEQQTWAYQNDPITTPIVLDLTQELTIQPRWLNDGPAAATTWLRYMSARMLN